MVCSQSNLQGNLALILLSPSNIDNEGARIELPGTVGGNSSQKEKNKQKKKLRESSEMMPAVFSPYSLHTHGVPCAKSAPESVTLQ